MNNLPIGVGTPKTQISGKISKVECPIRFRAAPANVERHAEMVSICVIGELPPNGFSDFFPPDPTPEIGDFQKHYD